MEIATTKGTVPRRRGFLAAMEDSWEWIVPMNRVPKGTTTADR